MKRREFLVGTFGAVALGSVASKAVQGADDPASGAYAELPGVKLWFTDSGGTGAPIVLLHANSGTSAAWASQIEGFSQAGYPLSPSTAAAGERAWPTP